MQINPIFLNSLFQGTSSPLLSQVPDGAGPVSLGLYSLGDNDQFLDQTFYALVTDPHKRLPELASPAHGVVGIARRIFNKTEGWAGDSVIRHLRVSPQTLDDAAKGIERFALGQGSSLAVIPSRLHGIFPLFLQLRGAAVANTPGAIAQSEDTAELGVLGSDHPMLEGAVLLHDVEPI